MPDKPTDDELAGELRLGVAGGGDLRWAVADVAGPLEAIRGALDLSPIAAVALGRALAAATLVLRFTTKEPGRLVLEVLGDGPLGKIVAEVDGEGRLRGRVDQPRVATPDDGGMAIAWAVGQQGTLRLTQEAKRGRYSSQVELVSGEIGKDLVHFLHQSQQIRSAALLGVLPRPDGIGAAGGLLVEAFPGVADDTLERLEANIATIEGVGQHLEGGTDALQDAVLAGFDHEELETHRLRFSCRCRPDALKAQIQGLKTEDLDAMTDADGKIIAECAFCATCYAIDREELRLN